MIRKLSKEEAKKLKKQKELIVKRRWWPVLWTFLPHLMTDYLTEMQDKGYIVNEVSNKVFYFKFTFLKKDPNIKVKYFADLRARVQADYFKHNMECGWTLLYTPLIKNSGFALWGMIEEEGSLPFYSEEAEKVAIAKKSMKNFFINTAVFCLIAIGLNLFIPVSENNDTIGDSFRDTFTMFVFIEAAFTFFLWLMQREYRKRANKEKDILSKKRFAKMLLRYNLWIFASLLVILIVSCLFTAKPEVINGEETINLFASGINIITQLQVSIFVMIIGALFGFLFTIPYRFLAK